MKRFLKQTILFFGILYGTMLVLIVVTNLTIRSKADFQLNPNIHRIVLGNSHPAGTFNDTLISNFKNLADPGDSYFYGYLKLKEILQQNPQVDTVYLEFNPKTIRKWEDSKIWKEHQIPNYLPFLGWKDHLVLASIDGLSYQQELTKGIHKNLMRMWFDQYQYSDAIGGFRHVKGSLLDSILKTRKFDPLKQHTLAEEPLSEHDLPYLKKLVTLCQQQQVTLIFVRSPYHKKFDARNFEDMFQAYRKEHYNDIPFLDFQDFPAEDSQFKDPEHLNNIGARKFSLWFEQNN